MGSIATVIYYTSNREDEVFEDKIRTRLLEKIGDLPLISVSHKPIDFGYNICVGDIGLSNQNVFRQLQLGALHAETPFIISAEADCLYPKEYFTFTPDDEDQCYRYDPIWILVNSRRFPKGVYIKKAYSECGQMVGRKRYIKTINERLRPTNTWWVKDTEHGEGVPRMWRPWSWGWFKGPAIINIKTANGMHKRTGRMKDVEPEECLPYWGEASDLRGEMFA